MKHSAVNHKGLCKCAGSPQAHLAPHCVQCNGPEARDAVPCPLPCPASSHEAVHILASPQEHRGPCAVQGCHEVRLWLCSPVSIHSNDLQSQVKLLWHWLTDSAWHAEHYREACHLLKFFKWSLYVLPAFSIWRATSLQHIHGSVPALPFSVHSMVSGPIC